MPNKLPINIYKNNVMMINNTFYTKNVCSSSIVVVQGTISKEIWKNSLKYL